MDGLYTTLCIFAHQDDEVGILPYLLRLQEENERVICVYATTGVDVGKCSASRNLESQRVLRTLGVAAEDILFAGDILGISDGTAPHNINSLRKWLEQFTAGKSFTRIIVPAWEGGHQDHDACHLIGAEIAIKLGLLSASRQFPLYRAVLWWPRNTAWLAWLAPLMFRVASPLAANGKTESIYIPWRHRLRCVKLAFSWSSQWRALLGLLPSFIWQWLVRGKLRLQPIIPERLSHPPHGGELFYERRNRLTWDDFSTKQKQSFKGGLSID